jgi:hypothetical protein
VCSACGEVLAERQESAEIRPKDWVLQEAVTDVVDASWMHKIRTDSDLRTPTPDAKTQLEGIEMLPPVAEIAPPGAPDPSSSSPFIAILKPFVLPAFDPTPVPSAMMAMAEPIAPMVITGTPLLPPKRTTQDLESQPTPLEVEVPTGDLVPPKSHAPAIVLALVVIAAAVGLIVAFGSNG